MSSSMRYGFFGAGAIAEVFIRRLLESGTATPERILAFDTQATTLQRLTSEFGVRATASNTEVAASSEVVFIAVPPPAVLPVLKEVAVAVRPDHLIISLAAAVSTKMMEAAIGTPVPLIRVIPNTPSWVGYGMNPFCVGSQVGGREKEVVKQILKVFGEAVEIPEDQMAIATALTAVGPTYVFPVIAALADAAIAHGLRPSTALSCACQVLVGAATLVAKTERSPASLSLMTSLRTLDEISARKLFIQAVEDAHHKVLAAEAKLRPSGDNVS